MSKVDRANYVQVKSMAYEDSPQSIGYGATISAPHMHAHAAEALLPYLKPGSSVLDVGSGSGYTLAIFHHLVAPLDPDEVSLAHSGSRVVGIEHIQELVDWSKQNLQSDGLTKAMEKGQIQAVCGDGRKGWSDRAPYDAIHVGAAAPEMPEDLVEQLASPGRLFVPVESKTGYGQHIWQVDKDEKGKVTRKKLFGVAYVPLTDAEKQWPSR
ncbi:putative l-isoaspartyl protein carboxyl methyltransferase [Violaceomyces palustris]|uniref:L-isoaspartyl protein carboxyl methyltransferase n=1 Tax=Violaceomyces palustris TaxID=1673888 RepID=A0ACD0NQV3_9BASI|nr:putative l-isoaspartyl protein carboxyl methyltransferase [Violaceomyces palustris]